MAQTAVDICNLALGYIGVRDTLGSLEEDTPEGAACARYYGHARDVALESFDWRFASKRALLTPLVGVTATGWANVFQPPGDMLVPRETSANSTDYPHIDSQVIPSELALANPLFRAAAASEGRYELIPGNSGLLIASNLASMPLRYTARVQYVPSYPPSFVDALAWGLAAKLALVLPVKPQLEVQCQQRYMVALAQARTNGLAVGGDRAVELEASYVAAREGY